MYTLTKGLQALAYN